VLESRAWEHASALLPYPAPELLALGYAELAARRTQKALQQFDRAAASLPPEHEGRDSQRFFASLAYGRAMAWSALGQQAEYWRQSGFPPVGRAPVICALST
jgi:hypothetical protein